MAFVRRHSLVIGIALMFLLTWPIYLSGSGVIPMRFPWLLYRIPGPFGFGAASILMTGLTLGPRGVIALLKRFLIWRVGWRWYASLLIIPGTYLAGIALHAAWNGITPDFTATTAYRALGSWSNLAAFIPIVFLADMLGNGEEIGWRGYALPRLQSRYAALFSALVMGLIWALWHLALFLTRMNPVWFAWYIVGVVAKSVLISWAYNGTRGSLLIATLYHAAWNTSGIFLPITTTVSEADIGAFAFVVLTEVAVVALVAILAGHEHLSRTRPRQMQA